MLAMSACILCAFSLSMTYFTMFPWLLFYSVMFGIFGDVYFAIITGNVAQYSKIYNFMGGYLCRHRICHFRYFT